MPSLKPSRLRGVACLVEVEEVRPKPSCAQRSATVPKPIRARLRMACTATCGSWAHAWTQRSPSLRAGSRLSAGKCGSSRRAAGWRSARPKRSLPSLLEQRRAEAEGERQPGGVAARGPRRCRSAGRRTAWAVSRPPTRTGRHLPGGDGPLLAAGRSARRATSVRHVERREVQPVLRRGGDAGLVLPVEGVAAPGRRRAGGSSDSCP